MTAALPRIAITMGDPAGVGPEICLRLLDDDAIDAVIGRETGVLRGHDPLEDERERRPATDRGEVVPRQPGQAALLQLREPTLPLPTSSPYAMN